MKLKQLLENRYPDDPRMRWAARRARCRKTLLESTGPLSGAYYWIPKPGKEKGSITWDLMPFYDNDYNDTSHADMWPEVLTSLALIWRVDPEILVRKLDTNYTALPRGRVNQTANHIWTVYHGNDSPLGKSKAALKPVIRTFNLQNANYKLAPDEHETMMPGDPERFQRVLGLSLNLRGDEKAMSWASEEM